MRKQEPQETYHVLRLFELGECGDRGGKAEQDAISNPPPLLFLKLIGPIPFVAGGGQGPGGEKRLGIAACSASQFQ